MSVDLLRERTCFGGVSSLPVCLHREAYKQEKQYHEQDRSFLFAQPVHVKI